ncbi:MAG TPA: ABC transporter permease subunit [Rhizomicrobium sp.]|nr:ABC transporter permease subunit [Rhizomicrobium sp.]
MWRYALKESGRWALAVLGALLTAAAVSALSVPGAVAGAGAYAIAFGGRLLAFLALDFGASAISGDSVAQELAAHGPMTADLVGFGTVIAILLGVPLGLALGTGPFRRATAPLIQIVSAAPVFCAGLALAYAARHLFGWYQGVAESAPAHLDVAALRAVLLPALTVGLAGTAAIQVALRRAASEAQDNPFRTGLRRLGLTALEIERVYVAPRVFAGLLSSLGEVMLALLSAAVVSEWVFQCRGIADLFVKSLALHDWNMAAAILLVFAAATSTAEFAGRLGACLLTRSSS